MEITGERAQAQKQDRDLIKKPCIKTAVERKPAPIRGEWVQYGGRMPRAENMLGYYAGESFIVDS